MWELDHKEGWMPKKLMLSNCGAGEDSWESLGQQADKTSQSQRKSILNIHWKDWCWSWSFNTLATWCEQRWKTAKLFGKDPDAGKDWGQEEKGTAEDEIVGWHHRLNGHEFEQAPGVGEGQGSLACCSSGVTKSWTWLSYRTTATVKLKQRGLRILVGLALGAPSTKTHRQASSLTTAEQCCLDPIQVTSSSLGKLFSLAEKVSFFFLIYNGQPDE